MTPTHSPFNAPRIAAVALGIALLASCAADGSTQSQGVDTVEVLLASGPTSYMISAGDTLSGIADRAGVSLAAVVAVNGWPDGSSHLILPGDTIALPSGATTPAPPKPAATATADSSTSTTLPSFAPCDATSLEQAIGDDQFSSMIVFECDANWAGGTYITTGGDYWTAILKAKNLAWVNQDFNDVCSDGNTLPFFARVYCPRDVSIDDVNDPSDSMYQTDQTDH